MFLIASRERLRIFVSGTNQIRPQEKHGAGLTYAGMIVSLFFFAARVWPELGSKERPQINHVPAVTVVKVVAGLIENPIVIQATVRLHHKDPAKALLA